MTLPVWRERRKAQASTTLSMNVSGTECYDFSSMGSNKALTGPTCQTLSVWIEQRRRAQEARSLYKVGSWGSVASGYLSWAMGDPADFLFILWSEKPLAHLALQDLILHECTPRFRVQILREHLGDIYDFVTLPLPGEVISPHQIGLHCISILCFLCFSFCTTHSSHCHMPTLNPAQLNNYITQLNLSSGLRIL